MEKIKVGDRVVCNNVDMLEELAGVVGEVVQVRQGALMDTYYAMVKYPGEVKKIPLEWLELYAPSHDYDEITISRKRFRDVVANRLGFLGDLIHGNILDDIEIELFGDTGDDD